MSQSNLDSLPLAFHHFGLAVRRPEEARMFLTAQGYVLGPNIFDHAQNVNLQMGSHPNHPAVEIIWPGPTPGPVNKLNHRCPAGIIYHLCYETNDLAGALDRLAASGLQPVCISPPTPAPLFGGRNVSFSNVPGMGLIEILEPINAAGRPA